MQSVFLSRKVLGVGFLWALLILGIAGAFPTAQGAIEKIQGKDLMTGKNAEYFLDPSSLPSETLTHSALNAPSRTKKATVVVFLSAKCPCSQSHETVLKELYRDFNGPEFEFVGVHSNADEDLDFTQNHFKNAALPFRILQDEQAKIADRLGAYKTPHVYVIGKGNEILFQGGVDDSHHAPTAKKHYLRNALTAIRAGTPITDREVRVLGCAIKRP